MSPNKHVKPLKPFDPKKDLAVNESFSLRSLDSSSNTLSDLESGDSSEEPREGSGREIGSFKTKAPIVAGLVRVQTPEGLTLVAAANKTGEVHVLRSEADGLKPVVQFKLTGSIIRRPAIAGDVLYCTTREGNIYAVRLGLAAHREGGAPLKPEVLWQGAAGSGILTEPIATGKILIVAALKGLNAYEAYYQDESNKAIGKILWQYALSGTVSSPALSSGVIYVGTEDRHLYALNYGGSKVDMIWDYPANEAVRVKPCIYQKGDSVTAASIDGCVFSLHRESGAVRWVFIVKAPVYSGIISHLMGNEEYFFFGADNGNFYCLNHAGKQVWAHKTGAKIRTQALVEGNTICFGAEDNHFYGLDVRTGKMIFKFSTDGNVNGEPVIVDGIAYFGSTDTFVRALQL